MASDAFYDLGQDPKKLEPVGADNKLIYPCLYVDADQYPPLKDMKIGDVGTAMIKFKIGKHMDVEVMQMKYMPTVAEGKPKAEKPIDTETKTDNVDTGADVGLGQY